MRTIYPASALLLLLVVWAFVYKHDVSKLTALSVSDLESTLDPNIRNPIQKVDTALANVGYQLITQGKANYQDHKGKIISSYFVCTDCHNLAQEYPTLTSENPEEKLKYTVANNLPFLPASSFYGIYNRKQFYTKDYVKKYGDLVIDARDTLENAVQLCAKYCSSGRYLESWELDAIMHYYKREELKVGDLNLSHQEISRLEALSFMNKEAKQQTLQQLQSNFTQAYTATFLPAMDANKRGYGATGNAERGKLIYENGCLHCHGNARVTYLNLDTEKLDAQMFWRNIDNYSDKSLYQIIRYGTYPIAGRKQYMPLYPEEKMSNQQLEDLVAYIRKLAEVK